MIEEYSPTFHEAVNDDGEEMKETAGGGDGGRETTCCNLFLPSNYFQLFAQTLHVFEWRTRIKYLFDQGLYCCGPINAKVDPS